MATRSLAEIVFGIPEMLNIIVNYIVLSGNNITLQSLRATSRGLRKAAINVTFTGRGPNEHALYLNFCARNIGWAVEHVINENDSFVGLSGARAKFQQMVCFISNPDELIPCFKYFKFSEIATTEWLAEYHSLSGRLWECKNIYTFMTEGDFRAKHIRAMFRNYLDYSIFGKAGKVLNIYVNNGPKKFCLDDVLSSFRDIYQDVTRGWCLCCVAERLEIFVLILEGRLPMPEFLSREDILKIIRFLIPKETHYSGLCRADGHSTREGGARILKYRANCPIFDEFVQELDEVYHIAQPFFVARISRGGGQGRGCLRNRG